MLKLCFGSFFTLISHYKKNLNNQQLYSLLCNAFSYEFKNRSDLIYEDPGNVSRRKDGKDNLPDTLNAELSNLNKETLIINNYKNILEKGLKGDAERTKKIIILGIKKILSDDTIPKSTIIGSEEYTKEIILSCDVFDFYDLLLNLMRYASSFSNDVFEKNVKEMDDNFFKSCEDEKELEKIKLQDKHYVVQNPLKLTADTHIDFKAIFKEVNPSKYKLSIPNKNEVKIFKLDVKNNAFDYESLILFLKANIVSYVLSRTKRQDIESKTGAFVVGQEALNKLQKNTSSKQEIYGDFMLHSFMEKSLNAPKIYSAFELRDSKSSGVYLLPSNDLTCKNQIVFGCSTIHDDIISALDDTLSQAIEIKNNKSEEKAVLFDESTLKASLSSEEAKYIYNTVYPTKPTYVASNDAFGMFLSYTINIPRNLSDEEFNNKLDEAMDQDILVAINHLNNQIIVNKLFGYSFYLFVVPLDDAYVDSETIIKKVGGEC